MHIYLVFYPNTMTSYFYLCDIHINDMRDIYTSVIIDYTYNGLILLLFADSILSDIILIV